MKRLSTLWAYLIFSTVAIFAKDFPTVKETLQSGYFCLSDATIYIDAADYQVVDITANMLADDIERVTGQRPPLQRDGSLYPLFWEPTVAGRKAYNVMDHCPPPLGELEGAPDHASLPER